MRGARGGVVLPMLLVLTLLLVSAGVGAFFAVRLGGLAAERRERRQAAEDAARAVLALTASWFEREERGALAPPPADAAWDREQRVIDLDGDGAGPTWRGAPAPWRVRLAEGEPVERAFGAPARLGAPGPTERFVGTRGGPDLVLARPRAARALDAIAGTLGLGELEVVGVRLYRPPAIGAPAHALARVEVAVRAPVAGQHGVLVRAAGEIVRVDWRRPARPLVTRGDMRLIGSASWRGGEALVGGDLDAPLASASSWPAGVPWLAPDRPLREDADGDGVPDDIDGNGMPDFEAWRTLPGAIPDPWWRARVGGGWAQHGAVSGTCVMPWPFGPRRTPPEAPSRNEERSGLFLRCAPAVTPEPMPMSWRALARKGRRGVRRFVEASPGADRFREDGLGPSRPARDLLPQDGAVHLLVSSRAARGDGALELRGVSGRGVFLVLGSALRLVGGAPQRVTLAAEGLLRDTAGQARAGAAGDDALPLESVAGCVGWRALAWRNGASVVDPGPAPCGAAHVDFEGLVASSEQVELVGPWRQWGQVRAAELVADGAAGEVLLEARHGPGTAHGRWPGPPGAPRVRLASVQILR